METIQDCLRKMTHFYTGLSQKDDTLLNNCKPSVYYYLFSFEHVKKNTSAKWGFSTQPLQFLDEVLDGGVCSLDLFSWGYLKVLSLPIFTTFSS